MTEPNEREEATLGEAELECVSGGAEDGTPQEAAATNTPPQDEATKPDWTQKPIRLEIRF